MKNNKGFTLIEIIAVITIIALIALFAVPKIVDAVKNKDGEIDAATEKIVYQAGLEYFSTYDTFGTINKTYCTQVKDLVALSYLDSSITSKIKESKYICYTYLNNKLSYEINDDGVVSSWILTEDNDNDGIVSIGDLITLNTESFYVISNDGTTIRALAKYNLLIGEEWDGTDAIPVTGDNVGLQDESAKAWVAIFASATDIYIGASEFSENYYWDDSGLKPKYGTMYPAYVYDNNSTLYLYLEEYKTKLEEMKSGYLTVDLIKKEELDSLGCDSMNDFTCTSSIYSWIYTTSYWTGSADVDGKMWNVRSNGYFVCSAYYDSIDFGVRPVISIPSSSI